MNVNERKAGRSRQRRVKSARKLRYAALLPAVFVASIWSYAMPTSATSSSEGPTFDGSALHVTVYATRATVVSEQLHFNGSDTTWKLEYTPAGKGEWKTAVSETVKFVPETSTETTPAGTIHHLNPETPYEARVVAINAAGEAVAGPAEFTTHGVQRPEIPLFQPAGGVGTSIGTTLVEWEAEIDGNGSVTSYTIEHISDAQRKEEEAKGESAKWTLDAKGTIDEKEDYRKVLIHIAELAPETRYDIRASATNSQGETSVEEHFETNTAHPQVNCGLQTESVLDVTQDGALLRCLLRPNNFTTEWRFVYATSRAKLAAGELSGEVAGEPVSASPGGEEYHVVEGQLSGLKAGTIYYFELEVESKCNPENVAEVCFPLDEEVVAFETAGQPDAQTFATHALHEEAVRALGAIAPNGLTTQYRVGYVPQESKKSCAEGDLSTTREEPANKGTLTLAEGVEALVFKTGGLVKGVDLPGLSAGQSYRYCFMASNAAGSTHGKERTIIPPSPIPTSEPECANERSGMSVGLVDCRGYELVTPTDKKGAQDIFSYSFYGEQSESRIGLDGNHVMVAQNNLFWGPSPDPKRGNYFFTREERQGGGSRWAMRSARPENEASPYGYQAVMFSGDLSRVAVEASWLTSKTASGKSTVTKFLTGPPGGPYNGVAIPENKVGGNGGWVAGTPGLGVSILQSEDHELCGKPTGTTKGYDLYELIEGHCRLLNETGGKALGTCGATIVNGEEGYQGNIEELSKRASEHVIATDGSRVVFRADPVGVCPSREEEEYGGPHSHVYIGLKGDSTHGETIDVGAYRFLGANADDSRLLLEAHVAEGYEVLLYDVSERHSKQLFMMTQDNLRNGQTGKLAVAEDFDAFYFTSPEQLTNEAPAPSTEGEDVGTSPANLYRYDLGSNELRFLAQIGTDQQLGGGFSTSREGKYLFFASSGVAGLGPGAAPRTIRLYRYDAAEDVVECMSCASSFDPEPVGTATFLPKGMAVSQDGVPDPAIASVNGDYAFFDTTAALVPQDVDGEVQATTAGGDENNHDFFYSVSSDVYEWRKNGVDGCQQVEGCLALITPGTGGLKNMLLGVADEGRDVFFATHEKLVGRDSDTAGDVYDARIGGGETVLPQIPECEGGACQIPANAPLDTTPGSFSFSGAGDVSPPKGRPSPRRRCKKGFVHRRNRCVRRKKRRHGRARHRRRHK